MGRFTYAINCGDNSSVFRENYLKVMDLMFLSPGNWAKTQFNHRKKGLTMFEKFFTSSIKCHLDWLN